MTRRDEMGFRMLIGREAIRSPLRRRPRRVVPGRPAGHGRSANATARHGRDRRHARTARDPFRIGELLVAPGRAATGELPISRLVTGTQISLPIQVRARPQAGPHGVDQRRGARRRDRRRRDHPAGDESLNARTMSGTLIAVPIVNVHGFLNGDRYLPDRRDLNRSFPARPNGSLAARIAHLFMTEIVTALRRRHRPAHRLRPPHEPAARARRPRRPGDAQARRGVRCAVMLHAKVRDGSLRAAATESGATMLLYEGGEAWRFDSAAIDVGVRGIRNVLGRAGDDRPGRERAAPRAGREPPQHRGCAPAAAAWRCCRLARRDRAAGRAARRDPRLGRQASEPDHRPDVPAS